MKKVCSQCRKEFDAEEDSAADSCPDCLRKVFRKAGSAHSAGFEELKKEQEIRRRKQLSRADQFSRVSLDGGEVKPVQYMLLVLGLLLVGGIAGLFMISESTQFGVLTNMSVENQRVLVGFFGVIAGGLIWLSSRHHRWLMFFAGLAALVFSWFIPDLWPPVQHAANVNGAAAPHEAAAAAVVADKGVSRFLTDRMLEGFHARKKKLPDVKHTAVYMHQASHMVRDQLRPFLQRMTGSDAVSAESCAGGVLYTIDGSRLNESAMKNLLSRLGNLRFAEDDVYEVVFDPELSHYQNGYSSNIVQDKFNASFAHANINELRCFDPSRIADAANRLLLANTASYRSDIRSALVALLNEPWEIDSPVLSTAGRALAVYGADTTMPSLERKMAKDTVQSLFMRYLAAGKQVPDEIVAFLVEVAPEEMVDVVVKQWLQNPRDWDDAVQKLGAHAENRLLEVLRQSGDNIQLINDTVRMLGYVGTMKSTEALEEVARQHEGTIRNMAESAISKIRSR